MNSKKISVVIPSYNSSATIERCLNSILNQTYENLEILVINDGSNDDSVEKIEKMQKQDNRIKLITIPNGGVSHARNVGIEESTGDYITFVDSDDYISEEMYEILMNIIFKYNVKIAHCSYRNVDSKGNIINAVGDKDRVIPQNHDDALECLISGKYFCTAVWNKLYDKSLFTNVRFDKGIKFSEDLLLNFKLFNKVEKSVYTDKPLYNYVCVEGSATHSAEKIRPEKEAVYVFDRILKISKGGGCENMCEIIYANKVLGLYKAYLFENDKKYKEEMKSTLCTIKELKKNGLYNSRRDKATIFLYKYFPGLFVLLYKIYDKIRVKKLDPEQ